MSTFSRVKTEVAQQMSDVASHRGLEHIILPFPGEEFSDWATFQFTNEYGKKAFDNLCAEHDVTVDGTQVIDKMLDAVVGGEHPSNVMEKVVRRKVTNGMANAYNRLGAKFVCGDCKMSIPKYPGAYPSKCPECGGSLNTPEK